MENLIFLLKKYHFSNFIFVTAFSDSPRILYFSLFERLLQSLSKVPLESLLWKFELLKSDAQCGPISDRKCWSNFLDNEDLKKSRYNIFPLNLFFSMIWTAHFKDVALSKNVKHFTSIAFKVWFNLRKYSIHFSFLFDKNWVNTFGWE